MDMEANTKRIKIDGGVEEEEIRLTSPNHLIFDGVIHLGLNSSVHLKPLRLVSKAWNESICSALRQITIVDIDEHDELKTKAFMELLQGRDVWENGSAPLPFIKVRLFTRSFSQPNFMDFIQNCLHNFIVTEFILEYDSCLSEDFQKHLRQILEHHSETITKLHISRSHSSEILPKSFDFDKLKFPKLTELNIDFNENMKPFLEKTLAIGKLQKAELTFLHLDATALPSSTFLQRVPALNFTIVAIDEHFPFQRFANLPLPNLKKLHLICVHVSEIADALMVIDQWQESLNEIHFDLAKLSLHRLGDFARLNVMALNGGHLRQFDPLIKEMYVCYPLHVSRENLIPRLKVTRWELIGRLRENYQKDSENDDDQNNSLRNFLQLFPNVETFSLTESQRIEFAIPVVEGPRIQFLRHNPSGNNPSGDNPANSGNNNLIHYNCFCSSN